MDRTSWGGVGQLDQFIQLGPSCAGTESGRCFRQGSEHGPLIQSLMSDPLGGIGRDGVTDKYQRMAVKIGLGHTVGSSGRPWASGDNHS